MYVQITVGHFIINITIDSFQCSFSSFPFLDVGLFVHHSDASFCSGIDEFNWRLVLVFDVNPLKFFDDIIDDGTGVLHAIQPLFCKCDQMLVEKGKASRII